MSYTNFQVKGCKCFRKIHCFHFLPFKSLCYQIWPWHKTGQGHPRIIIWTNFDGPTSLMLHTEFHKNRPRGSWEEDFEVFTSSCHGGHLGHVTWTLQTNFHSPITMIHHMKFDFNRPSGFGGEDAWKCGHTHRHTHRIQLALLKAHLWARCSDELIINVALRLAISFHSDFCHEFPIIYDNWLELVGWLCWGLTSQSTIFQSCRDGAIASWVINQYFRGVKCLAQGHNTAAVGLEPRTSRSGVRHSTTEPPRSPNWLE